MRAVIRLNALLKATFQNSILSSTYTDRRSLLGSRPIEVTYDVVSAPFNLEPR